MISDGTKYARIADGVEHAHEPFVNEYAATPGRFVSGSRATLHGMAWLPVLALLAVLALAGSARAQAPVSLGTAGSFAVLAGTTVTNTGPTVINGDLGLSPGTSVTGFPPGTVNGTQHIANAVAGQAQIDLTTAYNTAAAQAPTGTVTADLGGQTLTPGVYRSATSLGLTGTLTLDAQGNPNAVFIFQAGSTLITASGSSVNLINGAQACNVFWQVGSSATLGTGSTFRGTILALTTITATTGAVVDGRLLARNGATTLDSNTVTRAQCAAQPPPAAPPGSVGDETGPTVRIGGAPGDGIPGNPVRSGPKPCLDRDFRLRITAGDESGIRNVSVFLDGNLVRRVARGRFLVWIRAERLRAGRHTIRVVARDRAGNRTVTTRRFRRCARPVLPVFTG